MRRREFVALACGLSAWPRLVRAQHPEMPVVGFLNAASPEEYKDYVAGFLRGLAETGHDEGRNVTLEYRWAQGQYSRLPELAGDLVRRKVAVIAANSPAALPAKAATATIPIVFFTGYDPVEFGLVASLNRPGGNLTGVTGLSVALTGKQIGLLREFAPGARSIAFLVNPTNPNAERYVADARETMRALGLLIHVLKATTDPEIEEAFVALAGVGAEALVVAPDAFFIARRAVVVSGAERVAIPAIYPFREFAAHGLMTYAPSLVDAYRQMGVYAGRILKGENPGDLPVSQPAVFELVINLKVAKALNIDLPPSLLARADEVIE
jgi:putative tryptophan/tyrosine transport system substrate-binding protein